MKERAVSVEVSDILSLIDCAEDYGFHSDVLFDAFREWLAGLSSAEMDEEVEAYARSLVTDERLAQGYGAEDAESARKRLGEFRARYDGNRG